jgi:hypothetical protein
MTPIYSRGNVSQKCKESEKMAGATTAACGLVQQFDASTQGIAGDKS